MERTAKRLGLKKRIAFGAAYTALAILALELVLWLTGAVRVFRPFECGPDNGGKLCSYKFNSRTPDIVTPKPAGVFRIAVLGESAVKGWPFDGAGFPDMMSVMLNGERGGPVRYEVINLGVNGVSTSVLYHVLEDALPDVEPDLVILYAGNNELLAHDPIDPLDDPMLDSLKWWLRKHSRIYNAPANVAGLFLAGGLAVDMMVRVTRMEGHYDKWLFPPEERDHARDLYEYNLERMVRLCQRNGTAIALSTVGSNLYGWVPMKSVHSAGLSDVQKTSSELAVRDARQLLEKGQAENAAALLARVTRDDPDYARAWFYLGRARLMAGDAAGVADLEAAVEHADFHQQTPPSWNRRTRELARRLSVPLIDVDKSLRQNSKNGAPGFDLFVDGCHPTLRGDYLIAFTMIKALAKDKLIPSQAEAAKPTFEQTLEGTGVDRGVLAVAYFNQALVLAFLLPADDYDPVALSFLQRSAELGGDPALCKIYMGYLSVLIHDPESAARYFSESREANPATFSAAARTKLGPALLVEDPYLYVKVLDPDNQPRLYPSGKDANRGPVLDPSRSDYRFKWENGQYRPEGR